MSDDTGGPFQITAANAAFVILPGLTLMFTLAPAAVPAVPLAISGFFCAFLGAIIGVVVYRQVAHFGPLARIGALTVLLAVLYLGSIILVR